ncbi:dioxygenase [Mycobacterium tuberculosis]|nr:dioxygenase [Mycobacterium tuberculosis]CNJ75558.1 dioxygenase [Mycobacterium tuberculosis]
MDITIVGKYLSTLPEDDDHPYRTGPWRPQTTEWDADDLTTVTGEVPADLDGIYLRNTENPLHPAFATYHPFDGDGMIHVVGFRDGKAFYRNRFIRSSGGQRKAPPNNALARGIGVNRPRPSNLEETVRFYRDLVGMLDQTFAESYGSNGAIFGLPSSSLTLEIVETDHHEQLCRYCSDKRGQQAALTGLQEVATQPVEQRPL